jgi:hypothetical protein
MTDRLLFASEQDSTCADLINHLLIGIQLIHDSELFFRFTTFVPSFVHSIVIALPIAFHKSRLSASRLSKPIVG